MRMRVGAAWAAVVGTALSCGGRAEYPRPLDPRSSDHPTDHRHATRACRTRAWRSPVSRDLASRRERDHHASRQRRAQESHRQARRAGARRKPDVASEYAAHVRWSRRAGPEPCPGRAERASGAPHRLRRWVVADAGAPAYPDHRRRSRGTRWLLLSTCSIDRSRSCVEPPVRQSGGKPERGDPTNACEREKDAFARPPAKRLGLARRPNRSMDRRCLPAPLSNKARPVTTSC